MNTSIKCVGELPSYVWGNCNDGCGGIEDFLHLCGGNDIIPVGEMTTIH